MVKKCNDLYFTHRTFPVLVKESQSFAIICQTTDPIINHCEENVKDSCLMTVNTRRFTTVACCFNQFYGSVLVFPLIFKDWTEFWTNGNRSMCVIVGLGQRFKKEVYSKGQRRCLRLMLIYIDHWATDCDCELKNGIRRNRSKRMQKRQQQQKTMEKTKETNLPKA